MIFRIQTILLIVIAFAMPIWPKALPLFSGLFFIAWLWSGQLKKRFSRMVTQPFFWLFIGFFLVYILGMTYTVNTHEGWITVSTMLSMFLIPIMVYGDEPFSKEVLHKIMMGFIAGCFMAALICLGDALYKHLFLHKTEFYYSSFTYAVRMHPSYLAMYFTLAIGWILIEKPTFIFIHYTKIFHTVAVLLFSLMVFLCDSKMGILFLILFYTAFVLRMIVLTRRYIAGIFIIVMFVAGLVAIFMWAPSVSGRMKTAWEAATAENTDPSNIESTALRKLIWRSSGKIISEHFWLGVGTGDARDELIDVYQREGIKGAFEKKLNAHNQFVETFVTVGFVGVVSLVLGLLLPLWNSFKTKNTIYVLFLFLIIFNFLVESMLKAQAGVMFYALFNSLFYYRSQA